jgi:hypothetical protein
MGKRDLISEIEAKKLRLPDYNNANSDLFHLWVFNDGKGGLSLVSGLFPVGIVACIEVAVRQAIRRLIDHGPPYVDRISKFKDELKLDVNIGRALRDRRVAFGDLVSHLLPVSNVAQISSYFSILFEQSFQKVLADAREFVEPTLSELDEGGKEKPTHRRRPSQTRTTASPSLLPIADVDSLMKSLDRLFRARHQTAHEADFQSVRDHEVLSFFQAAKVFIHALNEIVS